MGNSIKKCGLQTLIYEAPPVIIASSSTVGPKEKDGPLGEYFDEASDDATFGQDSWEKGENEMIRRTVSRALSHASLSPENIDYIFGGDLNAQLTGTTFGIKDFHIPHFGLYGACSACGETLSLASVFIASGAAKTVMATASSHYAACEKQFRFPLEYGNQRPLSSTWTVTGCGAFILQKKDDSKRSLPVITSITTGKIVDYGITDSMNMGAAMAPAACDTIAAHFSDTKRVPSYYDYIITGDLGMVGSNILVDLLRKQGIDISKNHLDCGLMIFDNEKQDTHSGGSGCGCSAATLSAYILRKIASKEWRRVLFVPTGALLSTMSFNEGETIPGIAHAVSIECNE